MAMIDLCFSVRELRLTDSASTFLFDHHAPKVCKLDPILRTSYAQCIFEFARAANFFSANDLGETEI